MIKKIKWSFLAIIAALSMASCSNDEPGKGQDENDGGDVRYLAVQIIPDTQQGSRASSFELGSDTENKISKIRFYFFDEGGTAVSVKSGKNDNTYDYTIPENHPTNTGDPGDNIEKTLEAILIIDTKAGDQLPAQIVAVANPYLSASNKDLGTLRSLYADYAEKANGTAKQFVMANSVYATSGKDGVIRAVRISADNIQDSEEKAKANAVDIHIERNVAKVRAYLSQSLTINDNDLIEAKYKDGDKDITTTDDNQKIYIKILGWNITADTDNGYLSKHILTTWSENLLGAGNDWNDFNKKRSYWADALPSAKNRYFPYTGIIAPTAETQTNKGLTLSKDKNNMPCIYANENAAKSANVRPTEIIVAAQLCDATGSPLTICEYIGSRIVGTDALKDMMLTYLRNTDYNGSKHTHYKKVGDQWKEISRDDITFVLSNPNPSTPGENPRYPVIATLSQTGKDADWYSFDSDANITADNYPTITVSDDHVNNHLKALGEAKIWTDGYAYYHTPIIHAQNATNTVYGVVRNHIYELQISGFYGLGTPVYDPNNVDIIPEDPSDSEGYLAAQIYILSWALKTQKVEFGK